MGDPPAAWDARAVVYDKFAASIAAAFAREAAKLLELEACKHSDEPAASRRALDVGAGTGALSFELAELGYDVTATDYAPEMLAHLRANRETMLSGEARSRLQRVEVADGQDLGAIADGSYDVVSSAFALIFFGDRARGLRECLRAARPGGHLLVLSWTKPMTFSELVPAAIKRAFPDRPDPPPAPPGGPGILSMSDPAQIESELLAAGWTDVSVRPLPLGGAWPSRDALFEFFEGGVSLKQAAAERPDPQAAFELLKDSLRKELELRFPEGPFRMDQTALCTIARKPYS